LSIFDRIKHAIFRNADAAPALEGSTATSQASSSSGGQATQPDPQPPTAAAPVPGSSGPSNPQSLDPAPPFPESNEVAAHRSASHAPVDVEAILSEAAAKSGQKLNWRHSIVDLMKALGMDASLAERKELAQELG
jgi:hypothetical protein